MVIGNGDGGFLWPAVQGEAAHVRCESGPLADSHDMDVVGLERAVSLLTQEAPSLLAKDGRPNLPVVNARCTLEKPIRVCAMIQLLFPYDPSLIGRDVNLDRIQRRKHTRRDEQLCCRPVGRDNPYTECRTRLLAVFAPALDAKCVFRRVEGLFDLVARWRVREH